jgi:hypothetical protein
VGNLSLVTIEFLTSESFLLPFLSPSPLTTIDSRYFLEVLSASRNFNSQQHSTRLCKAPASSHSCTAYPLGTLPAFLRSSRRVPPLSHSPVWTPGVLNQLRALTPRFLIPINPIPFLLYRGRIQATTNSWIGIRVRTRTRGIPTSQSSVETLRCWDTPATTTAMTAGMGFSDLFFFLYRFRGSRLIHSV